MVDIFQRRKQGIHPRPNFVGGVVSFAVGVLEGCVGEVVACGWDSREGLGGGSFDGFGVGFEEAETRGGASLGGVWASVVRDEGHCC